MSGTAPSVKTGRVERARFILPQDFGAGAGPPNVGRALTTVSSSLPGATSGATEVQWRSPFSYVRFGGTPQGFVVDTAFRIYNLNGTVVYLQDPEGFFTFPSNQYIQLTKPCTCLLSMTAVGPNAGNYAQGWTPVYNSASINSQAGGFYYQATVTGVIQLGSVSGFEINRFASNDYIQAGGYCNSGTPNIILDMIVMPS